MNGTALVSIAKTLVGTGRGLLAIDESTMTCDKRQSLSDAGIMAGIKVDIGAKELAGHPGEKVTEGLDGLRDRLRMYSSLGARFAKWRAVILVRPGDSAARVGHLGRQPIEPGCGTASAPASRPL